MGNRFYQIVTIANDTLQFLTFTEKHELYDELLLIKSSDGSVLFEDKGIGMLEILNINLDRIAIDWRKTSKIRTNYTTTSQSITFLQKRIVFKFLIYNALSTDRFFTDY